MRTVFFAFILFFTIGNIGTTEESIDLWPGNAPGETCREPNIEKSLGSAQKITTPRLVVFRPEKKTSDLSLLIVPGGGYGTCFYEGEGFLNAKWWNSKGITAFVLLYRVPRPKGKPIYFSALQDGQRAIRWIRANSQKYGLDPNKIGVQGYSAGGHLTLLLALNSKTASYDPVDKLDKIPCNVAFAIPVYPAYVLDDGADKPNKNRGEGAALLKDFHFDENSPPLCLIHGHNDIYSSLGSIEIYKKYHQMQLPCELHVYTGAVHGFMYWNDLENAKTWRDRCFDWLKTIEKQSL
ncbi:MAG: alpha/beta hydrolase [Planctomycetia bacterium]|nr:alpha/beta hydrolase [Planctomycetia bacterium]